MNDRFSPGGRLYFSPDGVRVWIGKSFFDLGRRSLASCEIVAREFDLLLIQTSKPCPRAASGNRSGVRSDASGVVPGPIAKAGSPGDSERSSLKACGVAGRGLG